MKKKLLYSLILLFFGAASCNSEKSKVLDDIQTDQNAQDSIQKEELKAIALSFHRWYMAATDDMDNSNWSFDVVEGPNGKCQFDFYDYFDALRKLGTVSETFLLSEKERLQGCENYMKTVNYSDYISADAYVYQDDCSNFYYMYWIRSQEPFSGIEVEEITKKGEDWQAKLIFYNYSEEKEYFRNYQPIVTISKEGEKWRIVSIT